MANAVVEIFLNCTGSYSVIKNYPLKFLSNQSISLKSYSCFGDFDRAEIIRGYVDDPFLFSIYGDLGSPSIKIERVSIRGPRIVAFFQNETFTSSTAVTTPTSPRDDGRISKIHILHCLVSRDDWSRSTKSPILIQPSLADGYVPHFEIFIDHLIIIRGGGYQLISVPPSSINLTLSILDSQIWNTLFKLDVAAGLFSLEHTKIKNSENDEYDIEGHNLFELNNFDNVTIFAVSFDSRSYIKGLLWISNCSNVEVNGLEVNKPLYDWDNSSLSNKNNNNNNNNARTVIRSSGNTHRKSIVAITNSGSVSLKNCRYKQSYNDLQLYHNRILEISNTTINNLDIQNAINLTISNTYIKTGTPIRMSNNIAETVIIKTCGFTDISSSDVGTIHLESGKNVIIDNSTFDACSSFYAGTFYFGRGVLNVTITNTVVTSPKKKPPNSYTILKSEAKRLYLENVTMTVFNTIAQNDLYSSVPLQFWNFTFICPNSSNPVELVNNSYLACVYCSKGEYNLQNGYYKSYGHSQLKVYDVACLPCPLGGVCDKTITSKANFWGFVNEDKQIVSFIPCPAQYCCNGQENPCVGLDTCAPNRTGNICGQCQSDHYIDLFSPQCIPANHCLDEDSNLDMRVYSPYFLWSRFSLCLCHLFKCQLFAIFLGLLLRWE